MKKTNVSSLIALSGFAFSAPAMAFNLATDCLGGCPFVTYGDGNSYALPINAILYNAINGGGTGPGNPQYVVSTPGAIQDLTVIATGASGGPVNTNYAGADNAFATPSGNGGAPYFSTATGEPTPTFTGDRTTTWDVQLSALKSFLSGDAPIFFFNNNQVNSGASTNQNLAAWAQLTIRDAGGNIVNSGGNLVGVYDFTNQNKAFAGLADGGGGSLNGSVGAYTHAGALDSPIVGTNAATDYVLSGGELCYNRIGGVFTGVVSCSGAHTDSVNLNLGANQAAYALVFPELNAQLALLDGGAGYTLNVNLRFGCDPAVANPSVDCVGRSLNNGYEQVFIGTAATVINVPEPTAIALLGIGMIGLFAVARRSRA